MKNEALSTDPTNVPEQGTLHTPGPWYVRDLHPGRSTFNIGTNPSDPYDGEVAVIFRGGNLQDRYEANAHLIAAAPDLLEVLRDMVQYGGGMEYDDWRHLVQRAEAAIAKATGNQP